MAKQKWDQHSILAELRRRGMTLAKLAEINGQNPSSFRHVWNRTTRKAEAAIAAFLDEPVEALFPDRYPIRTSTILDSRYDAPKASRSAEKAA